MAGHWCEFVVALRLLLPVLPFFLLFLSYPLFLCSHLASLKLVEWVNRECQMRGFQGGTSSTARASSIHTTGVFPARFCAAPQSS